MKLHVVTSIGSTKGFGRTARLIWYHILVCREVSNLTVRNPVPPKLSKVN